MGKRSDLIWMVICVGMMVLMILDSSGAAQSAADAVELCLRTVIPGLFPMLVLSAWLVPRLDQLRMPGLRTLLHLTPGSEGLFLLGLIGGFPTGGAAIAQAVASGSISRRDGERMLGFCNNCAPAFLFGVAGAILGSLKLAAALAVIQAVSAFLIGHLWPGAPSGSYSRTSASTTLPQAVRCAASGISTICAWVVLASVALGFLKRWLFPLIPEPMGVILTGLLELTNGCLSLRDLTSENMQFVLCCFFVCFGGVSVLAQIQSFAAPAGLNIRTCALQKLCQGLVAAVLGMLYLRFGLWTISAILLLPIGKKAVEILQPVVYNTPSKGGI